MEHLYSVTEKNTLESQKNFYWARTKKRSIVWVYSIIMELVLLAFAVVLFIAHSIIPGICFLLMMVLLPLWLVYSTNRGIEKRFKSAEDLMDADVQYNFFDTYLLTISPRGNRRIPYEEFANIFEDETHLYLVLAKGSGACLTKANCPQGLDDFLFHLDLSNPQKR